MGYQSAILGAISSLGVSTRMIGNAERKTDRQEEAQENAQENSINYSKLQEKVDASIKAQEALLAERVDKMLESRWREETVKRLQEAKAAGKISGQTLRKVVHGIGKSENA